MRRIDAVIVHHSASDEDTTVEEIRSWHRARGFKDIGYHWVVRKGAQGWECIKARAESEPGAHCEGHNAHTIGVVVCGNYSERKPSSGATSMLVAALRAILVRHKLNEQAIFAHRAFKATECPGKFFEIEAVKAAVKKVL